MSLKRRGRVYHFDVAVQGERLRGSTHKTNKKDAEWEVVRILERVQASGVQSVFEKAPLLESFAGEFLQWVEAAQSLGEHAKRLYPRGWRLLKDTAIAKMPMDKISNDDCDRLTFPGGPANANCALRTLRRMRTKAKEMKRLYGDLPRIALRKERPRSVKMSWAEALRIDSHWKEEARSESSRDAFRIICSSGMRPSECFRMRWEYMQWDQSAYCNPDGKSDSSQREVPLSFPPFDCMAILKDRHERMGRPGEGWIFPSPTAKHGHMTTINKPFNRARVLANVPKVKVLYTARHGVATAVAEVTTLKESMQLLGHSDVKTALGYQHPDSKAVGERLWERLKTQKTESDAKLLGSMGVKL